MTTETILTDERIFALGAEIDIASVDPKVDVLMFSRDEFLAAARAIERAVLQSDGVSCWKSIKSGQPNYGGQFVLRINKHGHLRLGSRVLNPDTLRHQWQVDGEICNTVTHYLPIPALTLSERES